VADPVERMDHAAYLASVELAPGKARTAALFKKPSQALEDAINHGRVAAVTARGFTEMQGGLPIVVDMLAVSAPPSPIRLP
jgi:glc operon protein GlcG